MTVFFTADTHFGHAGARALYRRPFDSVAAMDAAMEERWNAAVGPGDEVWHLGDFALRMAEGAMAALLERLHGRKHLVTGNNDGAATLRLPGWASVQAYAEMAPQGPGSGQESGQGLVLCHYAFRTWRNMHRGWLNLHGHSHARLAPMPRQVDVGVDAWAFRPVTLAEILATKRRRTRPPGMAEGEAGPAG